MVLQNRGVRCVIFFASQHYYFLFFLVLACVSGYFSFEKQFHTFLSFGQEKFPLENLKNDKSATTTTFSGNKKAGFISLTKEVPRIPLACQGTIPSWLNGRLLGTGPAQFELGKSMTKYWFNGLAMLHSFVFEKGTLYYHNKFLESAYYKRCMKNGKFDSNMSTEKPKSFFSRLTSVLMTSDPYDNGTIALTKLHDKFVALTETPLQVAFDPTTLKTTELIEYKDTLNGHLTTAQFQYDYYTNEWYNYLLEFGNTSNYHIYKIQPGKKERTLITSIPVKNPAYMRSFGMTKNYIILVEIPFVVNPLDLLLAAGAFIENIAWKPELGTHLIVINKHTGELVGNYVTEPFFMSNVINAFERKHELVVDVVAHHDTSLFACTTLAALRNDNRTKEFPSSWVHRLTLNLKKQAVTQNRISNAIVEFPTINKNVGMNNYSFVYGVGVATENTFPHQLVKINLKTGASLTWSEDGCYAGAPTFVANPKAHKEDDGVITSVVFDSIAQRSFLLIIDAKNFTELARATVPHHIPLGLMSQFYAST